MSATFDELDIELATTSDYALRHGVLYDLLGRYHRHDMRESTVAAFMRRYHVDPAQAERVEKCALRLYNNLAASNGDAQDEQRSQLLGWAACLHEIGISIAYNGYHKHSAYMLQNADMPGFSRMEQARLAALVHAHRGALAKAQSFISQAGDWPLVLALRLAVLLNRRREGARSLPIKLAQRGQRYELTIDGKWLRARPLTQAALKEEIGQWRMVGRDFRLKDQ